MTPLYIFIQKDNDIIIDDKIIAQSCFQTLKCTFFLVVFAGQSTIEKN